MRRIAWYTLVVLSTLTVLVILWQFNFVLVMLLLSIATSAAFRPVVDYFIGRGFSKSLSLAATYLIFVLSVVVLLFAASGALLGDLQHFADDFVTSYERIKAQWPLSGTLFQRTMAEGLPAVEDFMAALSGEQGLTILQGLLGGAMNFFGFLGQLAVILILSAYWSTDRLHFERLWLSLVPGERRSQARELWRSVEAGVGAYIRSEAIQSVIAGLLLWLGYRAMGLNYPALLAVLGALAWLIPWLGAVLAILPPLLVGWGTSLTFGVFAAAYTLVVLMFLEFFVEPRFFTRKGYSSLLTVVVIIPMGMAFGLIGVILAPPLAAALQIFFRQYLELPQHTVQAEPSPVYAGIKERLAALDEALAGEPEEASPELKSLRTRLQGLVNKTEAFLNSE